MLGGYNYKIAYRPGGENANVDEMPHCSRTRRHNSSDGFSPRNTSHGSDDQTVNRK